MSGGEVPRLPLALLHPDGAPRSLRVLGNAVPGWEGEASDPDLVVVALTPSECLRPGLLADALRQAEEAALSEGMGYVMVPRRWRLRAWRRLRASGAEVSARVHLPGPVPSASVVPMASGPLRYTFGRASTLPPWLRVVAGHALSATPALALAAPGVGFTVTAPERPAGAWLSAHGGSVVHVALRPGWRGGDAATVVLGFPEEGSAPMLVAKAAGGPASARAIRREDQNLEALWADVEASRGRLPRGGTLVDLGGYPALVQGAVAGEPAVTLAGGGVIRALRPVSDFLLRWNLRTRETRPLLEGEVEDWIEAPLQALAPDLPLGYPERLRAEASALRGLPLPLVAAHHDLTASNLLLDGSDRPGLVDWEEAEASALPLTDLLYLAADLVLAAEAGSRADALRQCVEPGGRYAEGVRGLVREHARGLELSGPALRLAFQACWLRHAWNEARRAAPGEPRPFLEALRWAAAHPAVLDGLAE